MPPLLHTPDQITDRPLVALRVMLVPTAKEAEPVVPTGTFSPAGVERTLSPARPVAVRVSSAVAGAGAPTPQTFATPPPPQVCGAVQTPHVSVPPQPSGIVPQFFPWAAQVVGVQGAGLLATTPDQRVSCVTPPTVQRSRIAAVLPAATVPLATKPCLVYQRLSRKFAITHEPTDPRAGFDDNRVGKSRIVDRDSPKFRETVARAESEEGTAEPCPSPTPTDDQREGQGFQSRATAASSDDW